MYSRSDIEAIIPRAFAEVIRLTGVSPQGFGITALNGDLALAITLFERPAGAVPDHILGVPVVFRISDPPYFLSGNHGAARHTRTRSKKRA